MEVLEIILLQFLVVWSRYCARICQMRLTLKREDLRTLGVHKMVELATFRKQVYGFMSVLTCSGTETKYFRKSYWICGLAIVAVLPTLQSESMLDKETTEAFLYFINFCSYSFIGTTVLFIFVEKEYEQTLIL
jgi:hypothetical protein